MRFSGLLGAFLTAVLFAAPAHAASTLTLSVPTVDPVEERPMEVTASGSLDASRVLFVFARPETAAACGATAADEFAKSGVVELTGTQSWQADGDTVAAGAYSRTRVYTPPLAQAYRLCAYVSSTASGVPDATATTAVPARRATATAALAAPTSAVEEGPVAITASGTTENARKLVVFAESGATDADTCATTASGENQKSAARAVIGSFQFGDQGESLGAGDYAQQEPFTPPTAGRYRLCAYVYRDPAAAPYATATRLLEVTHASASAQIAVDTADPAEEASVSVTVSGTTERARNLFVVVESGASSTDTCATTYRAEDEKAAATTITDYDGDAVAPSLYTQTHPYTPAEPGLHRVCAYLHRTGSGHVYAYATHLFTVRRARADVTLAASTAQPVKGQPFTVTASGSTERTRRLWIFVESGIASGATCSANPAAERQKSFAARLTDYSGDAVTAPHFVESRPFTPATDGPRLICAYVQQYQSESDPPYAAASLLVGGFAAPAPAITLPAPQPAQPLKVTRRLRPGTTRRAPGTTLLTIQGKPGTSVTVRTWRGSGRKTGRTVAIGASGTRTVSLRWGCARPGRHRYEVVAAGETTPVRGSWTVTRRHCRSLRR